MNAIIIELYGPIPSVKNSRMLVVRGKRAISLPRPEYAKQMESLILQARASWRARPPLEHPAMTITLYVKARRQDRDNMLNCLMDVLVKAGVLVNDNIARCNGRITIEPAVVGDREGARIELS